MPLKDLPKEIWTNIAFFLRRPVLSPREVMDRKEIRQPDLVNMMCTSKLFNNASAPALYHTVVCDDLAALFLNFEKSTAVCEDIPAKKTLLRFTHTLHLEYPVRELTDQQSMEFFFLNRAHQERNDDVFGGGSFTNAPQCAILIDCEKLFVEQSDTQLQHSMPGLERLCLAWLRWVGDIQKVFTRMYLQSRIKYVCQSSTYSPMCIHPVELYHHHPTTPLPANIDRTITIHISLKSFKFKDFEGVLSTLSTLPNAKIRWCFDEPRNHRSGTLKPFLTFADRPHLVQAILLSLNQGLVSREEWRSGNTGHPVLPFDIEAFIPLTDTAATMLLQGAKVVNPPRSSAQEKQTHKKRTAVERMSVS